MKGLSFSASSLWAPFCIAPCFSERIWGCPDLRPWYDVGAEVGKLIGEAWLTGDLCRVASGAHAGRTLAELFAEFPEALLGAAAAPNREPGAVGASPLLIKVIFAREKLSVQVHPDDRMARKYGAPRGKTECWYVLEARPGAQLALGLRPGVTLDQVQAGIGAGTLEESLNVIDVTAGDVVFVDAGTVHAIWPGSILLEIQQNCDLTYRMYDYGRPRELHIDKSLEATRLRTRAGRIAHRRLAGRMILMDGEYFRVERIVMGGGSAGTRLAGSDLRGEDEPVPGLQYLFAAAGAARISGPEFSAVELPLGGIVAIPAAAPEFAIEDLGGLDLMRITPRWPAANR
ncbi:MAG: class I mannose-6-phosphate isomerase [Terracidiphilus sp.]